MQSLRRFERLVRDILHNLDALEIVLFRIILFAFFCFELFKLTYSVLREVLR